VLVLVEVGEAVHDPGDDPPPPVSPLIEGVAGSDAALAVVAVVVGNIAVLVVGKEKCSTWNNGASGVPPVFS
jgi:hypothetical protein